MTMFAGHLILLPSLGVYLMLLISKLFLDMFYVHILWSGIFFQEIVVVYDPENLHTSQIHQIATHQYLFLS